MATTDLYNTVWKFNDVIDYSAASAVGFYGLTINFIYANWTQAEIQELGEFISFNIDLNNITYWYGDGIDDWQRPYQNGRWIFSKAQTIKFTEHMTDTTIIEKLQIVATRIDEPVRVTESSLYNIASAIRSKNGLSTLYTPAQMASAIRAIGEEGDELFNSVVDRTVSSIYNNTVSYIGAFAFAGCESLTTANFPTVTSVDGYAFQRCTSLTTVSFPLATSISFYAFYDCSALTTISFPAVMSIGTYAFASCSLITANFPQVLQIDNDAFAYCSSLTTASFPVVTNINGGAFQYCTRLTSLYLTNVSDVPGLDLSVFGSTPIGGYSAVTGQYGSIYVPANLYSSFLTATNWTSVSSRITPYITDLYNTIWSFYSILSGSTTIDTDAYFITPSDEQDYEQGFIWTNNTLTYYEAGGYGRVVYSEATWTLGDRYRTIIFYEHETNSDVISWMENNATFIENV